MTPRGCWRGPRMRAESISGPASMVVGALTGVSWVAVIVVVLFSGCLLGAPVTLRQLASSPRSAAIWSSQACLGRHERACRETFSHPVGHLVARQRRARGHPVSQGRPEMLAGNVDVSHVPVREQRREPFRVGGEAGLI